MGGVRVPLEMYRGRDDRHAGALQALLQGQDSATTEARMTTHRSVTLAELERIACLSEELGETEEEAGKRVELLTLLIQATGRSHQAIGKVLRHGYAGGDPAKTENNREGLEREVGDVLGVISLLLANGDLRLDELERCAKEKLVRMRPYLHYRHKFPTVEEGERLAIFFGRRE